MPDIITSPSIQIALARVFLDHEIESIFQGESKFPVQSLEIMGNKNRAGGTRIIDWIFCIVRIYEIQKNKYEIQPIL